MKFVNFEIQTFATTYTTASEISTETVTTDTTVLLLSGEKLVTKPVFDYGLWRMRKYAKDNFFPKTGVIVMGTADVDTLFASWEVEDAAEVTVESSTGDETVPSGGGD